MDPDLLADLLNSWMRRLRSERKSQNTLDNYRAAINLFLKFCDGAALPRELNRGNVLAWLEAQADNEPTTVRLRLTAVKLFCRWLAKEEGYEVDAILTIEPPKLSERAVPTLSAGEIARLVKACDGPRLIDKRDKAMVMVLGDCGLRASELLALDVTDVNLDERTAEVRGKGNGGVVSRIVRFTPETADVLDRYLRARRRVVQRPAEGPLFTGVRGHGTRLSYNGLVSALVDERAAAAGLKGFHLHLLRHSMATRWLRGGGSEVTLRAAAGWSSNAMVARYTRAAAGQLACEEFDRLGLGLRDT